MLRSISALALCPLGLSLVGCFLISPTEYQAELDYREDPDGDGVLTGVDCDDDDPAVGAEMSLFYADADGDGYGDPAAETEACSAPSGHVDDASDCDDTDAEVNPDATEICNDGADNDCDGSPGDCQVSGDWMLAESADAIIGGDELGLTAGFSVAAVQHPGGGAALALGASNEGYFFPDGAVYLFEDAAEGEATVAGANGFIEGTRSAVFGVSVDAGADFDGDGEIDLMVGAFNDGPDGELLGLGRGGAYVFSPAIAAERDDEDAVLRVYGEVVSQHVGYSVRLIPDLDGDGLGEALMGAPSYEDLFQGQGRAYLFSGRDTASASALVLDDADLILAGDPDDYDGFGAALASADVDGDGYGEIFVGAPAASGDTNQLTGVAYLFQPGASGELGPDDAEGTLQGTASGGFAGISVDAGADADGDGAGDLLVGAMNEQSGNGVAYLIYGPLSGTQNLSSVGVGMEGEAYGDQAGWKTAFAGDVNGDAIEDLMVGANLHDNYAGATYVVYGPLEDDIRLSEADVQLTGSAYAQAGHSLLGADLNGDGLSDLVIGAPYTANERGAVYVIYGRGY